MPYTDDDMLMLSGIQHYKFCPRQWALIHLEQQWNDNMLTAEGHILHTRVDDPTYRVKNGDTITLRGMHIASSSLGLYGVADAVELIPSDGQDSFFTHPRYPGKWQLFPVEYKHGRQKPDERDEVQLAAEAMCMEEMFHVNIPKGAFFYFETRTREYVDIDEDLRQETMRCAEAMHELFRKAVTPPGRNDKSCTRCSLADVCCPKLKEKSDVENYLGINLYEKNA